MKGALLDLGRTVWALGYWNARKAWFVLRQRRGTCPCHNPSDSGRAMVTGCEAVAEWHRPERFKRRVCPLLTQTPRGQWVCGVDVEQVRPFWGRPLAYGAVVGLLAAIVVGFAAWGGLRLLGYRVTAAQVFWPPRWGELRASRVELFIAQARDHYAAGRIREAIAALSVAYEMDPGNYALGMMLAHFYQAGGPEGADQWYARIVAEHPARRAETVRVWFRSLLARGRMSEVAALARQQLREEPTQAVPWAHALLVASRQAQRPDWLEGVASDLSLPPEVRAVIALEAQVRRAGGDDRAALLAVSPQPANDGPYARVHRIELWLELKRPADALRLLTAAKGDLGGRDVVRLALAAYAVAGERAKLTREIATVLAPDKKIGAAEITLVAQHLIRYPDVAGVQALAAALPRVEGVTRQQRLELAINVLCAAGAAGHEPVLARLLAEVRAMELMSLGALQRLAWFFTAKESEQRIEVFLPVLQPFGLDLSYAMLARYR